MKNFLVVAIFCLTFVQMRASEDSTAIVQQAMIEAYFAYLDSVEQTFDFQKGNIQIKDGLATLLVPEGYKYLGPEKSALVLTDLWGNPPDAAGNHSLGMLFPEDLKLSDEGHYAINITYSEDGYIDDSDAKDIDYDELLTGMQEDAKAINADRIEMGYEAVELVGWASPPYYDSAEKKLHWAKELRFGTDETNTLNYNIRILGRKGYLQLNVIGGMDVLPEVKTKIGSILPGVNFTDTHRYADFDPKLDRVAAYGIGGLIAGKVLAKAGILAKIGILLAKFWKFIALAVIAGFAGIRRLFGGKEQVVESEQEA